MSLDPSRNQILDSRGSQTRTQRGRSQRNCWRKPRTIAAHNPIFHLTACESHLATRSLAAVLASRIFSLFLFHLKQWVVVAVV